MLFFAVLWSVWLMRYDKVFNNRVPDYDTIFLLILTRLCSWLRAIYSDFSYSASDLWLSY
uniref:EXS domain-containing protein n=1 Tax=Populus trichocarpa TaxID=3694 RepID=A0A3N7G349_POPTR